MQRVEQDPQGVTVFGAQGQAHRGVALTGAYAQNILGFYALMLRPGQALALPLRSPAMVFHALEGDASVRVGEADDLQTFGLAEADTGCAHGDTPVTPATLSASAAAFVFIADETPLHQKLGVFEVRA